MALSRSYIDAEVDISSLRQYIDNGGTVTLAEPLDGDDVAFYIGPVCEVALWTKVENMAHMLFAAHDA